MDTGSHGLWRTAGPSAPPLSREPGLPRRGYFAAGTRAGRAVAARPRRGAAFFAGALAFARVPGRPEYVAMNFSVSARARSSGRWLWGDFIRYDEGPSSWPPTP